MFFEIFVPIFLIITFCAALWFHSSMHSRCNLNQPISRNQCANSVVPLQAGPLPHKPKVKRKRSRKSKQHLPSCNDQSEEKGTADLKAAPLSNLGNRNVSAHAPATDQHKPGVSSSEPVSNLKKLDRKARNRTLFSTENATEPFTFTLDEHGGCVNTPYCKLLFRYRAVVKSILITVTPKYHWKRDEGGCKLLITPEIYFTSKDEMKFKRPVEVQLQTHYSATKKTKPINVEIERTEHCISPSWLKIDELKFSNGLIKFFVNQFCGFRAVCDSCQKSIMSRRVSYSISVREHSNMMEPIRDFYFRMFTDTPDLQGEVETEMENDGHRRIHPSQKYTIRHGYKVMAKLMGENLVWIPSFEILETTDDVISEAVLFQLEMTNRSLIMATDFSVSSQIAEISPFKTTRMRYLRENSNTIPKRVNFTIYGGSGIQANINVGHVSQENITLPSNASSAQSPNFTPAQQFASSLAVNSVQVHSVTSTAGRKAFEVTPVEETALKSPVGSPQARYVNYGYSPSHQYQNRPFLPAPSPILHSSNYGDFDIISQHDTSLWNRPQCSSRLSSCSMMPNYNESFTNSSANSDSHPTYTQTLGRLQFFSPRSAFRPLVRNSSHPSLASLNNLFPSIGHSDPADGSHSNLSALDEEYRNQNCGFSDEVYGALLENENQSTGEIPSSCFDRGIQAERPSTLEHPSALSSGFESGFSTRDPSCTDFEAVSFSPIDYATMEETQPYETEVKPAIRPRSVSYPREAKAKLLSMLSHEDRERSENVTQSVQIKSYSNAVKTTSIFRQTAPEPVKQKASETRKAGSGKWKRKPKQRRKNLH